MLVTDRLVYVQMQKTACTRIAEVLRQVVGGYSTGRKHGYLDVKPPDKLVVGSVRDPWAWYVSLWAFGCEGRGGVLSRLKHDEEWMRLYSDVNDPRLFRAWLKRAYTGQYTGQMRNGYGQFSLQGMVGFMTYRYAYLYIAGIGLDREPGFFDYAEFEAYDRRHNMVDAWIRAEVMAHDLACALKLAGYHVDAEMRERLEELCDVRSNTSKHLPYADYYDDESAQMVMERERLIMGRHGYG